MLVLTFFLVSFVSSSKMPFSQVSTAVAKHSAVGLAIISKRPNISCQRPEALRFSRPAWTLENLSTQTLLRTPNHSITQLNKNMIWSQQLLRHSIERCNSMPGKQSVLKQKQHHIQRQSPVKWRDVSMSKLKGVVLQTAIG